MLNILKQEYNNLPEQERIVLCWGLKIFFSETSKFIILFILFTILNRKKEFLFATIILSLIRCNMGGLHYITYYGCFTVTLIVYITSIIIFPAIIRLNPQTIIMLLNICIILNIIIGPVINPTRPLLDKANVNKIKCKVGILLLLYNLLAYLLTFNIYIQCGIWIIMEQTLQLAIAKIQRKENVYE